MLQVIFEVKKLIERFCSVSRKYGSEPRSEAGKHDLIRG